MSSVEERVKKLICEQLGVKDDEVKNDASFVEDLGADSLDTVELVMALEEEFETEIPDEEAEKITTVKDAIDYILAPPVGSKSSTVRIRSVQAPFTKDVSLIRWAVVLAVFLVGGWSTSQSKQKYAQRPSLLCRGNN